MCMWITGSFGWVLVGKYVNIGILGYMFSKNQGIHPSTKINIQKKRS